MDKDFEQEKDYNSEPQDFPKSENSLPNILSGSDQTDDFPKIASIFDGVNINSPFSSPVIETDKSNGDTESEAISQADGEFESEFEDEINPPYDENELLYETDFQDFMGGYNEKGEYEYDYSMPGSYIAEKKPDRKFLKGLAFILSLILAFGVGVLVRNYVITRVQVSQTSMSDTLCDGDKLYINRLDKGEQFDIVVIYEPLVSKNWLIKRIIAVGGQEVEISDGILYITENGVRTAYIEEYVYGTNITQTNIYIPEGYIYVLGDNRSVSVDSADYGVISYEKVIGKAIFVQSEEAVLIESVPVEYP